MRNSSRVRVCKDSMNVLSFHFLVPALKASCNYASDKLKYRDIQRSSKIQRNMSKNRWPALPSILIDFVGRTIWPSALSLTFEVAPVLPHQKQR